MIYKQHIQTADYVTATDQTMQSMLWLCRNTNCNMNMQMSVRVKRVETINNKSSDLDEFTVLRSATLSEAYVCKNLTLPYSTIRPHTESNHWTPAFEQQRKQQIPNNSKPLSIRTLNANEHADFQCDARTPQVENGETASANQNKQNTSISNVRTTKIRNLKT